MMEKIQWEGFFVKKLLSLLMALCMLLTLAACGSSEGASDETEGGAAEAVFKAGFGVRNITPKDSVPMASYGDARDRWSTGMYSELEARCVAVQDAEGNLLLFIVGDLSWCPNALGKRIRTELNKELGIPEENIILSGTHTHASVDTSLTEFASVPAYNTRYVDGMKGAAHDAVADLKPAEVYVGSVMTEGMNYVRRYFMDDGSLDGDNAYGTGTVRVAHETEADGELQLMKFVREGGKDILIAQFQAHPHLEGKTNNISAQTVGATRDAVEAGMDVHCLGWNGAAGNLNSRGSLEGEKLFENSNKGRIAYGEKMYSYIKSVYDDLTKVNTGTIQVQEMTLSAPTNHMYDHMTTQANDVVNYFKDGHTASETATYAHQYKDENGLRINSYFHASRIMANSKLSATQDMVLAAWSFGDVGGVVLPYELFDVSGMQMKEQSPFARTFIVGYSYPSYCGYIPTEEGYANGGYEADNSTFAPGTAELMVENYLDMLNDMHG